MSTPRRIGYIGVDVLNNATVCNESVGLLRAGTPLDVVSVHPVERPTYSKGEALSLLRPTALYPLGWGRTAGNLVRAPWLFGGRFWRALAGAFTCPAEDWRSRLRILAHFVPGVALAVRWRGENVGHIHAHWAHTATTIAMHAAALLGVGFSFTGHANDLFVYRVGLTGKVRRARFVVAIAEYHRQFYLGLGADPRRLEVVYCGIDLEHIRPVASAPDEARPPCILSVGRLVEKKGFHDLLAACALLRDRGLSFRCVIAGSGPEEGRLRQLVEQHGLNGVATVTGANVMQEELPALLGSARVFALPCVRDRDGDMDGLPQVLIEAMACGLPVVSTRLVGVPDLVRDGENGFLVAPGDIAALADALEKLLRDRPLGERFGTAGRQWVNAHFGREETVRRLGELFAWCAAHPGDEPPPQHFPAAPGSEAFYAAGGAGLPVVRAGAG